jgi:hypothetical protein
MAPVDWPGSGGHIQKRSAARILRGRVVQAMLLSAVAAKDAMDYWAIQTLKLVPDRCISSSFTISQKLKRQRASP